MMYVKACLRPYDLLNCWTDYFKFDFISGLYFGICGRFLCLY